MSSSRIPTEVRIPHLGNATTLDGRAPRRTSVFALAAALLPLVLLSMGGCSSGSGSAAGTAGTGGSATSGSGGHANASGGTGGHAAAAGGGSPTGGFAGTSTGGAGGSGAVATGGDGAAGPDSGAPADAGTDAGASPGVCMGDPSPNPDVKTSCTATKAKVGAACTQNCCLPWGLDSSGTQTCTCKSGKYSACTAPRPASWDTLGGECGDSMCETSGGPCSPDGYATTATAPKGGKVLDGMPCVQNGAVCFTEESGGLYGCLCASTDTGDFFMRCGLVNGWFTNNGQPTMW
jgi:hypothetical protein